MLEDGPDLDSICDAFEDQWRVGPAPDLEAFLVDCPTNSLEQWVQELACVDLEWRRKLGMRYAIEDYSRYLSERDNRDDVFLALIEHEIKLRRTARERVHLNEYVERFPELESRLQDSPCVRRLTDHKSTEHDSLLETQAVSHPLASRRASYPRLAREILISTGTTIELKEGEFLIREGHTDRDVYFIQSGTVRIVSQCDRESERVLDESGPGDVVGEMALLSNEPRTSSVCATSGVMAIRVPAEEFHRVAQKYPQLASMMTDIVAERLGRRDQDALSGKVLQGYRIERMLGRGGNGIVYLAVDLATQDRVALKMMSHRLVYSDRARVLFQKEAETVSRMNHPGIIRLRTSFDAFHTCFIVFDLVEGQTLAARMEAHSLQTDEIESVLVGLAETLRYAHARGVIHRDLKPANVMILPSGRVCLMDFGLAAGPEESGVICGTPRYMAPEQRVGKKLTPASDWFALGVIGYEMFVGRPLFGGDATEELGRSFHQWDPDFSRLFDTRLGTSIAHMLRVDPRERIPFPRSSDT